MPIRLPTTSNVWARLSLVEPACVKPRPGRSRHAGELTVVASPKPSATLTLLLATVLLAAACESRREVLVPLDGESLAGLYWEPRQELSAALLLIPEAEGRKEDWIAFAERLRQSGYGVLAIDLRTNESAGEETLVADVAAGFAFLRDQKRVDAARLGAVGVGVSGDGALRFSAAEPSIRVLVLLSPRADAALEPVMAYYGSRPVLLAAGQGELHRQRVEQLARRARGPAELKLYEGEAHGLDLLGARPDLERAILEFLELHLSAPVLDTTGGGS